ncbi:MAG: bifunctional adenosylcobinamide kinase/adenosylcobinamide-phosphate guanylyltransferase, partial [Jannaschia sp.]
MIDAGAVHRTLVMTYGHPTPVDQKKFHVMTDLPRATLVLGHAASGKSAWAETLVLSQGKRPVYVATAALWDAEMRAKAA